MAADLSAIQRAFQSGEYRITTHGLDRMMEQGISIIGLEFAIGQDDPEIIEDYPTDPRGSSCLILGWTPTRRPLHAVVGYSGSKSEAITAYEPDPDLWIDYRRRRRNNG